MRWSLLLVVAVSLFFADSGFSAEPRQFSVSEIAERSKRAVALVLTSDKAGHPLAKGTCFAVSSDGKLVTNFHVIKGAASALVKFPNGAFFAVKGVVGTDQAHDIAVLQAEGSDFAYLTFQSEPVRVGEAVVALGNPVNLEYTVSNGIISAVRNEDGLTSLQTTAAIAHGSSGGPLLNMHGQVVGVISSTVAEAQNANFAVPSKYAQKVLAHLASEPLSLEYAALLEVQNTAGPAPSPKPAVAPAYQTWISLQSAGEFRLRHDGLFMYLEYLDPSGEDRFLCELRKHSSEWSGVCRWRYEADCPSGTMSCKLEQAAVFRFVTQKRIEGTIEMPTLNCTQPCAIEKTTKRSFTLIPKD